jgi:hypothetical protein
VAINKNIRNDKFADTDAQKFKELLRRDDGGLECRKRSKIIGMLRRGTENNQRVHFSQNLCAEVLRLFMPRASNELNLTVS